MTMTTLDEDGYTTHNPAADLSRKRHGQKIDQLGKHATHQKPNLKVHAGNDVSGPRNGGMSAFCQSILLEAFPGIPQ